MASQDEIEDYMNRFRKAIEDKMDEEEAKKNAEEMRSKIARLQRMMAKPLVMHMVKPPPVEPHDPFDLKFEVLERYLTGEIVIKVTHGCQDPRAAWFNQQQIGQIYPTPPTPPFPAGGTVTITSTGGSTGGTPPGMSPNGGGMFSPPMGISPAAVSAGNALQQLGGGLNGVAASQSLQPPEPANILGVVRLTLPDCPEFEKITEAAECKNCHAIITGDIMRMSYFKHLTEKL